MTNLELKDRLGFKKVGEMFIAMGFSSKKMSDIKKENKEKKVKELLLSYYEVSILELVEMLEEKGKIKRLK